MRRSWAEGAPMLGAWPVWYPLNLNKIGKASFGLAEVVNAEPQKEAGDHHAHREIGQAEGTLAAQDAPTESVNDAHHRVKGIERAPLFGDDTRAEPDRRDIKPKLHDKRNDVA